MNTPEKERKQPIAANWAILHRNTDHYKKLDISKQDEKAKCAHEDDWFPGTIDIITEKLSQRNKGIGAGNRISL